MATFEAKKLDLTQINGGQEYEQGDFLQSDTINDVVEGTAYAQNVAEAANTTSNNAVSTANSANSTANAASAKVDTFDQRITTAQNTADTAVSNAATAQSTADSATTEINKIKNGTTVVPNANHANNADNAAMATKAQQDVNGKPINTTYATVEYVDDLVTEKQCTRVQVNNVNVAELSFTSDPQTQLNAKANQNGSYKTLNTGALINDDTRSVNSPPSYYYGKGSKVMSEFKYCSTVELSADETYCNVVTVCPWTDDSGGAITQIALIGNKKYTRKSTSDSAWGDWCADIVFDDSEILPYTTANGWTKLERFGGFPPITNDGKLYLYLIVAIPANLSEDNFNITGAGGSLYSPILVVNGFSGVTTEEIGVANTSFVFPYYSNNKSSLLFVSSYPAGIPPYFGIGTNGFIIASDTGTIRSLTDEELDGITYRYKRIV